MVFLLHYILLYFISSMFNDNDEENDQKYLKGSVNLLIIVTCSDHSV